MEPEELSSRISDLQEQLLGLLSTEPASISDVFFNEPPRFNVEGVYMISTPDDRKVVWVGRTITKSIIGRIADHRSGATTSDLKRRVRGSPEYPQNIDEYLVRCVAIPNPRERILFEHFSIGALQPALNK